MKIFLPTITINTRRCRGQLAKRIAPECRVLPANQNGCLRCFLQRMEKSWLVARPESIVTGNHGLARYANDAEFVRLNLRNAFDTAFAVGMWLAILPKEAWRAIFLNVGFASVTFARCTAPSASAFAGFSLFSTAWAIDFFMAASRHVNFWPFNISIRPSQHWASRTLHYLFNQNVVALPPPAPHQCCRTSRLPRAGPGAAGRRCVCAARGRRWHRR